MMMRFNEEGEAKNIIADAFESWSINLNSIAWREELKGFYKKNQDIQSVYIVIFLYKWQLLMIWRVIMYWIIMGLRFI